MTETQVLEPPPMFQGVLIGGWIESEVARIENSTLIMEEWVSSGDLTCSNTMHSFVIAFGC